MECLCRRRWEEEEEEEVAGEKSRVEKLALLLPLLNLLKVLQRRPRRLKLCQLDELSYVAMLVSGYVVLWVMVHLQATLLGVLPCVLVGVVQEEAEEGIAVGVAPFPWRLSQPFPPLLR